MSKLSADKNILYQLKNKKAAIFTTAALAEA